MYFNWDKVITGDEREKLYEEIWNEPVYIVAERHNMSDTALRKWCIKYKIPLPYSGYWAKIRAGKEVKKTELPEVTGEAKRYVRNYNLRFREDLENLGYDELKNLKEIELLNEVTQNRIKEMCLNLKVPKSLSNPHELILEHKDEMKYRESRDKALSKVKPRSDKYYEIKEQYREDRKVLSILVSNQNLERAYCFLDTIFKAVEKFEATVASSLYNEENSIIFLMQNYIKFRLIENKSKLALEIFPESWGNNIKLEKVIYADRNDCFLENQISDILFNIFVLANKVFVTDKLEEIERQREYAEEERKRKLKEFREGELKEVKILTQLASDWEKANKLREFIVAAKQKLESSEELEEKHKVLKWLQRAESWADWLDPLIDYDDEILGVGNSLFKNID